MAAICLFECSEALELTQTPWKYEPPCIAKCEGSDPTVLSKTKTTYADLTKLALFRKNYEWNLTEATKGVTGEIVEDAFLKADKLVDFGDALEGVTEAISATIEKFRLEDPNVDLTPLPKKQ